MREYVRRWPIADQEMHEVALRAEAIPDLLEELQALGVKFVPQSVRYAVVHGVIPFFEARLVVHPKDHCSLDGVAQLEGYAEFESWHAQQYFNRLRASG